ncbi:ABC transporter permease [Puia dinghuensis]|uniref:ABC transporter permease n=1 Tax=Puia dinghuensis TaxID=1792502 RepID=A0A8J2UHP8_9BACT|nr:ABC transporter permease [Puia dinghuensis]GGB19651.1 ABC transporter permease [Puia dinghuensis]
MLRIYFRAGFRSLLRRRSFSLINLIGLSLGFSAIMVMAIMIYQYVTANGQFQNKDRMYYVKLRNADGAEYMYTPYPFLYTILQTCPDVEAGTHLQAIVEPWLKAGDKEFQDKTWFVDTGFFRVFSFPLEYGDPATALRNKANIVLSHEMAAKLFGSGAGAIGKTLVRDDSVLMTVTGVLQSVASNTSARPEVLLPAEIINTNQEFMDMANWYNGFAENYLLLRRDADTAKINAQLNRIVKTNFDKNVSNCTAYLAPYSHFVRAESGNLFMVLIKALAGAIGFILLVMVANLINLNAATLLDRQKEMAVRKMMGSSRLHLMVQFLLENAMTIFAGLFLAFLLFRSLLLPMMNEILRDRFGTIALNIRHDYPLLGIFIIAGLFIVVLVGSFPALHFGSLRAIDAIKGQITGKRERNTTRNLFITLQFALATVFIGIAIIFNSQIRHMKGAALGFDQDNVLIANTDLAYHNPKAAEARYDVLLNDLRHNPAVLGFTNSNNIPTAYGNNFNIFVDPVTSREQSMRQASIDAGMLQTYRIKLLAGKNFSGITDSADRHTVIINHRAAMLMGWTNAVGRQLRPKGDKEVYTVAGVTEDFHYGDLSRDIDPVIFWPMGRQKLMPPYLSIRVAPGDGEEIGRLVAGTFKDIPTRRAFSFEYLNTRIDKQYALMEGILNATNYIALLTVFIAAMGLFGLIAAYTRRRVKEVGIRKVLGADVIDIVRLLSRSFLLLIGVALAVATPIAWLIMHNWLQDFAYRIDIKWWMLASAGLIALVIAAATVGYHALRAARANPVLSLRTE